MIILNKHMKKKILKFLSTLSFAFSFFFLTLILFHFGILILKSIKKENLYYFSLHENDYVKKNYSHLTNAQISDLLKSTWYRKWKYSPILIFYEGPIKSNFVNVNNFGVRSNHKKYFN